MSCVVIGVVLRCITAVLLFLRLSKDKLAALLCMKMYFTLTRGTEQLLSQT